MKLRVKTLAVLIITTICLIALLHFISEAIILDNFQQLEQTQVSGVLGQVQVALTDELDNFQNKVNAWAKMSDVTGFIEGQSVSFDSSTSAVASWVDLGVNYVLVYDLNGNFVTGVGFNLTSYHQEAVPQTLLQAVSRNQVIWSLSRIDSATKGILLIPDGALIVVSSPIPSRNDSSSMQGALIMARYLDFKEVASLSRTVQLPVTFTRYSDWQAIGGQNVESSTFSQPINTNYIIGYYVVKDLQDQPALLVGVTIPRSVYVQGIITVNYVDRLVLISCVVFSVTVALLLEFLFLSKVTKLTNDVGKVSKHNNPSERLPTKGNDEIETLTRSINGMLDELEDNTHRLQKAERFSAIGELATMIAHDLRNPLQGIAVATFYLKRKINALTTDKEKEMLNTIEEDVRYSDKIVNDLLDYSKEIKPDMRAVAARTLVWKALSFVTVPERIRLIDETSDEPLVNVDSDGITRVFTNIISNAVDAMPNGGSLTITCQPEKDLACFNFTDTGEGINKEALGKLFQPLFTTKAKGMGFGLSICKRIVDSHGGKITVNSTVGKGASFKIYLPIAKETQS